MNVRLADLVITETRIARSLSQEMRTFLFLHKFIAHADTFMISPCTYHCPAQTTHNRKDEWLEALKVLPVNCGHEAVRHKPMHLQDFAPLKLAR